MLLYLGKVYLKIVITFKFLYYEVIMSQVPAKFYPRKVICCPYLVFFINEIFNVNILEYSETIKAILYCKMAPEQVFSTQVKWK